MVNSSCEYRSLQSRLNVVLYYNADYPFSHDLIKVHNSLAVFRHG